MWVYNSINPLEPNPSAKAKSARDGEHMIPRTILIALIAFGFSALAHGAEIHDKPDAKKWAAYGNHTGQGWDIIVNGEIVPGDDVRFAATLNRVNQANPGVWPVIVWLNSTGGEVETSEHIADLINHFHLSAHVDGECASSCFLLFMAAAGRTFSPDSKIGVHGASQGQGRKRPFRWQRP